MNPLELLNLPDHVLLEIAENVGFPSIAKLQKVNRRLRNLLSNNTVNSKIRGIEIIPNEEYISIRYTAQNGNSLNVDYSDNGDECHVRSAKKNKKLVGANNIDIFCQDLQINLRHQKSNIDELNIEWSHEDSDFRLLAEPRISQVLHDRMHNRHHPLKVTELFIIGFTPEHLDAILPHLDADSLKSIKLVRDSYFMDFLTVPSDEVRTLLERYKPVDVFHYSFPMSSFDILPLCAHLKKVWLCGSLLTLQLAIDIKEMFLASDRMKIFQLTYHFIDETDDIEEGTDMLRRWFGEPFDDDGSHFWYFRLPGDETVLLLDAEFLHDEGAPNDLFFVRSDVEDVKEGATIQETF